MRFGKIGSSKFSTVVVPVAAALLIQFPFFAFAVPTVCTMTFNSSEEAQVFKQHLTQEIPGVRFEELIATNFNQESDGADLLTNACNDLSDKKITCDILIISGHFAGRFFGEKEDSKSLELEKLESLSCNPQAIPCRKALLEPKEVYLFGCNTLAGKEKDSRTPEEYRQVLIRDGFSETTAQLTALFRYSNFGDSNANRMSRIFEKTPLIYGFNSIGPSGKTSYPFLQKFFESIPSYRANLSLSLKSGSNQALARAYRSTAFTQENGQLIQGADPATHGMTCEFTDPSLDFFAALKKAGQRHLYDAIMPQLLDWAAAVHPLDANRLQEFRADPDLNTATASLLKSFWALPDMRLKFLKVRYFAGWIGVEAYKASAKQVLRDSLNSQNVTRDGYAAWDAIKIADDTDITREIGLRMGDFSEQLFSHLIRIHASDESYRAIVSDFLKTDVKTLSDERYWFLTTLAFDTFSNSELQALLQQLPADGRPSKFLKDCIRERRMRRLRPHG